MQSILMNIQAEHNSNIEKGLQISELRTRAPRLQTPFKVYTYESGINGRQKVVNEWICKDITTWRMCAGLPAHLSKVACVSNQYIWDYCDRGRKEIDEMHISDLVIYDKPKELSEFMVECNGIGKEKSCFKCDYYRLIKDHNSPFVGSGQYNMKCVCNYLRPLKNPPKSWCYVVVKG